jgi:lipoprotein-anchoring transpeptidase ErfK/SrfK
MASKFVTASQALKQAYEALQRGDKHEARYWAQIATSMAPNMEYPWLILAAVARPHASIAYLERALEINPKSERARAGLDWAYRRQFNEKPQPVRREAETSSDQAEALTQPNPVVQKGKSSFHVPSKAASAIQVSIPALVLTLALCLAAAWAVWPGASSSALAAIRSNPATSQDSHVPSWSQADLAKPTYTPLPTATFTPTATPSPTPIPTATPTFTATPLPTNTAQPSDGQPEGEFVATQLPAGGEKFIVVSIHEQHLYAYQGSTLVYSFVASTGSNNGTRTGTYHILDKIPNAYGVNWNFWMPDWMGIYYAGSLEDGIHALPILPNGQRLWAGYLGTPITYGCVVLGVQESQDLYDWADVGTTVQINR